MKVIQLIDSLDAGGAERIAVTFANSLSQEVESSHLCVTRSEGVLKDRVVSDVHYCFIKKTNTLDFQALLRLRKYLKLNKIEIVHAHTTSYFFATLVKIFYPRIKLIWHTHYGARSRTQRRQNMMLYLCSFLFYAIITVNEELRSWCLQKLATSNVIYLPNFVQIDSFTEKDKAPRDKTIVCLANLKEPKNHVNLIQAFEKVHTAYPDWKLLLAGKDFSDSYSEKLKEIINNAELQNKVVFLGQQKNVETLLVKSSIGVLASDSEGLPMALLEYGAARLAVVATDVGNCKEVISGFGCVVSPNDPIALADALISYISDDDKRKNDAARFSEHIHKNYSVEAVLPQLIEIYKSLIH